MRASGVGSFNDKMVDAPTRSNASLAISTWVIGINTFQTGRVTGAKDADAGTINCDETSAHALGVTLYGTISIALGAQAMGIK